MSHKVKPERPWGMCAKEGEYIAEKIAALFAESAATVNDMIDIFQMAKEYLIEYPDIPPEPKRTFPYGVGMYAGLKLDRTRDDDGIWNQ